MCPRAVRATLIACLGLSASACGLFPPLGGTISSLEGKVENGMYTSPDGSFSLQVPHDDSYELNWCEAKEVASADEFYVSFGPAAFDKTIYRCSVSRLPPPGSAPMSDLAAACKRLVDGSRAQLEPMTGTPLEVVAERDGDVGGKPAHFVRLVQKAPAGKVGTEPAVIIHEACLARYGERFAFTWVQTYQDWPRKGIDADRFVRSVVVR